MNAVKPTVAEEEEEEEEEWCVAVEQERSHALAGALLISSTAHPSRPIFLVQLS